MSMTALETASVVNRLQIAYRADVSAEQYGLWHDHLQAREHSTACATADRIIASGGMFFPSVAEFNTAYQTQVALEAAQQEERMLGAPTRACDCDQGWHWTTDAHGNEAVRRCERCNPASSLNKGDHESGCHCMVCRYGPAEAQRIRDGAPAPKREQPELAERF